MTCRACRGHLHGEFCQGGLCRCSCRAVLGLDGPFPFGDPTLPWWDDRYKGVA